ncbi:MAG: release factor glutamine methyltransferase [Litorilinea sp.]|nr:MAG: release factor glutamine methyltransferase [Litorilinea sp.]
MAILQVNVRPANGFRRGSSPQRRERGTEVSPQADSDHNTLHNGTQPLPDSSPAEARPESSDPATPLWQRIVWTLMPSTTVGRAIVSATQRLEEAGSDTAHLDAQVILAHVLGVDRSWLFAHYDYKLSAAQANAYTELVARRVASEPVAYIVGRKEFYGLEFVVDRRVLIPRPETELLVDAVLDHIQTRPDPRVRMADVGTGSGAIAVAVAANCPTAQIYAIDLSPDALAVARQNVARLDTRGQITLLQGDLLAPLPEAVDIIAANLPYIRQDAYDTLDAGIREYEPRLALEAGEAGLDAIERLLAQAPSRLRPGGVIFLEIGHDQGEAVLAAVERLIPNASYVGIRQDYHGHDRLLTLRI